MGLVDRAPPADEVLPAARATTSATSPVRPSPSSMAAMKCRGTTDLHASLGAAERTRRSS